MQETHYFNKKGPVIFAILAQSSPYITICVVHKTFHPASLQLIIF